ncbi:MAG: PaaI family thioesterase [Schwartzia sp.]|nr:PaaI family thioesterase [Schwartzia sp. (in: firmicutes)]
MEQNQNFSDNYCFACGTDNPRGLRLTFAFEGERLVTRTTLAREYQGYPGTVHGGIVTTLLDETMANYMTMRGEKAVTGRIEVRYRRPTPVGAALTVAGWLEKRRGDYVTMKAEIRLDDGTVTAEGTATMAVVEKLDETGTEA